ncbi:MAG: transcriptional repressor [Clostridium sp.]|nr:transcriptional repressor [Clostridium sp.]MDY3827726.1 transcriptional repressor [Clostridium sp.]
MDNIIKIFKEKKIKITPQRLAVYNYLANTTSHPSVETIYEDIYKTFPTMSLATVYKTIKTLVSSELVQELNVGEGNFRYDANTNYHPHIQCTKCGKVDDIFNIDVSPIIEDAKKATDFVITSNKLYFYGLCPDCQNQ